MWVEWKRCAGSGKRRKGVPPAWRAWFPHQAGYSRTAPPSYGDFQKSRAAGAQVCLGLSAVKTVHFPIWRYRRMAVQALASSHRKAPHARNLNPNRSKPKPPNARCGVAACTPRIVWCRRKLHCWISRSSSLFQTSVIQRRGLSLVDIQIGRTCAPAVDWITLDNLRLAASLTRSAIIATIQHRTCGPVHPHPVQ
jgi:hypothetical protein